jgi:hypothetical protein
MQKNFLYYYILQYFHFIANLLQLNGLKNFLHHEYLNHLSYMNIIQENIEILSLQEGNAESREGNDEKNDQSDGYECLFYFGLLKYTRAFILNKTRLPTRSGSASNPPSVHLPPGVPVAPPSSLNGASSSSILFPPVPPAVQQRPPGITALNSTYLINQSIYIKDIEINLKEIVHQLLSQSELMKNYSFHLIKVSLLFSVSHSPMFPFHSFFLFFLS